MTGPYKPGDEEIVNELCNARDCNWEAISSNLGFELRHGITQNSPYTDFILTLNKNLPDIPILYIHTPAEWRETSLSFIENQIRSSPDAQKNILIATVERYRIAARKRLTDIFHRNWIRCKADSEQYQTLEERYHRFMNESIPLSGDDLPQEEDPQHSSVYNFLGKTVTETELMKKVLILQELKERLEQTKRETATENTDNPTLPAPGGTYEI